MTILGAPPHRPLFPRGPGLGLRALLLMLVCSGLMASELRGDPLTAPRQWLAVALDPLVWVADIPVQIGRIREHLRSRQQLIRENAALQQRQMQLLSQLQRYRALDEENRRLRELLDASARLPDRVAVADIIAANQDPYRQQITLDKGERHGVYRGQALVDANGVLGQVVQVYPSISVALLLTDPDHGIPVEINRTGLQATALGQGGNQRLRLPFLPANAEIQQGDLVVSSSLGGRFPSGYPVARVESVHHTPGGHFKEAIAIPAASIGHGRQALLVWSERPVLDELQAGEAAAAEAHQAPPPPPETRPAAPPRPTPSP